MIYLGLLIAPVLFAGLAFILVLHFRIGSGLEKPLDQEKKFLGKRIFGENKTYLGFIVMPFFTLAAGFLLKRPFAAFVTPVIDESPEDVLKFGLLGFAFALGELPNSFIKRQLDIPPGARGQTRYLRMIFDVFDAIDSLLAVGLVYIFIFGVPFYPLIFLLPIGGAIHLGTDLWMRRLRLKT